MAPYIPEQNGITEAANKVVLTKTRSIMINSGLPAQFWTDTVLTAVFLTNRTSSTSGPAPLQKFSIDEETPVDLTFLRRFRCLSYVHIDNKVRSKFEYNAKFGARALRGYLVGY